MGWDGDGMEMGWARMGRDGMGLKEMRRDGIVYMW